MKKFLTGIAIMLACVIPALAGMDSVEYNITCIGIAASATNSKTYVLRGVIESIYLDGGTTTGTVTITDSYGTLLTQTYSASDTQSFPRRAGQSTTGSALTWTEIGSDNNGATTNAITTTYFQEKIAVAGPVKVTVDQTATGGTASQNTNDYAITIMFNK